MTEPTKPIPVPNEDSAVYWRGCNDGKLLLQRCGSCGHFRFYPRILCTNCSSLETEWVEASGRGAVYSYSVIHRAPSPAFKAEVPYVLAVVVLDEGVRMMTNIVDCAPDQVRIDMPVRVRFDRVSDEIAVPKFAPAQ